MDDLVLLEFDERVPLGVEQIDDYVVQQFQMGLQLAEDDHVEDRVLVDAARGGVDGVDALQGVGGARDAAWNGKGSVG